MNSMIIVKFMIVFIILPGSENMRTVLTSVRYGFTVISNLLVYLTTWIFFGVENGGQQVGHEDDEKFR